MPQERYFQMANSSSCALIMDTALSFIISPSSMLNETAFAFVSAVRMRRGCVTGLLDARVRGVTKSIHSCYALTMLIKDKTGGQDRPLFTEAARRAQIIECAIETLANEGYARASLDRIAKRAGT
jgi:hypothetical protein